MRIATMLLAAATVVMQFAPTPALPVATDGIVCSC